MNNEQHGDYLIGFVQVAAPRPHLALVVPVGGLHEVARGRRDLRVLAMVYELKLLGLDVEYELVYVLVGGLLLVAPVAFDYLEHGAIVVAVLRTELLLPLVEHDVAIVEKVRAVLVVLDHLGESLVAAAQTVQARLVIEEHGALVLRARLAQLILVLLERLAAPVVERLHHPASGEVGHTLGDLVVSLNELLYDLFQLFHFYC